MKFLSLLLPKYDPRISSNRVFLSNLCFQSYGSLGEQFFTFLSQNSRVLSHQTSEVQIQSKARLFNQTGVFIIVFYCSTNFCFNHNVVFVITFYFCSCLFIALVARNILTLKLLCSFEDVTEFTHHLIRRQKHSTTSHVSLHTSFAL